MLGGPLSELDFKCVHLLGVFVRVVVALGVIGVLDNVSGKAIHEGIHVLEGLLVCEIWLSRDCRCGNGRCQCNDKDQKESMHGCGGFGMGVGAKSRGISNTLCNLDVRLK